VDHLGTVRYSRTLDPNGNLIANGAASFKAEPFGVMIPSVTPSPNGNTHFYTGHERDTLSSDNFNQDYAHFRFYGSSMGRFFKPDSQFDGAPGNTQGWNLYSYVKGNPINFNDPTGHATKNPGEGDRDNLKDPPDWFDELRNHSTWFDEMLKRMGFLDPWLTEGSPRSPDSSVITSAAPDARILETGWPSRGAWKLFTSSYGYWDEKTKTMVVIGRARWVWIPTRSTGALQELFGAIRFAFGHWPEYNVTNYGGKRNGLGCADYAFDLANGMKGLHMKHWTLEVWKRGSIGSALFYHYVVVLRLNDTNVRIWVDVYNSTQAGVLYPVGQGLGVSPSFSFSIPAIDYYQFDQEVK
jgi:RHS repeat-associated protein